MRIKKINTESTIYQVATAGLEIAAFLGGEAATLCVVLPFVKAVCRNDKKLRVLAEIGAFGLSMGGAIEAAAGVKMYKNLCVDVYNGLADIANDILDAREGKKDDVEEAVDNDIPEEVLNKPLSDYEILLNQVVIDHVFEFSDEAEAQAAHGHLMRSASTVGFTTLSDLYGIRHIKVPEESYQFGWTKEELEKAIVDQIDIEPTIYLLDLPSFHDITNFFEPYKDVHKED